MLLSSGICRGLDQRAVVVKSDRSIRLLCFIALIIAKECKVPVLGYNI